MRHLRHQGRTYQNKWNSTRSIEVADNSAKGRVPWKQRRKLMQPALSHTQIGNADIVVTHALRLADSFQDGEVREINADMVGLTLGVAVKALRDSAGTRDSSVRIVRATTDKQVVLVRARGPRAISLISCRAAVS